MARLSGGRSPIRGTILPGIFCLLALILVALVLVAGVNNKLTSLYYLKTDTSKLSLPSKLSTSDFLKDLSQVSGSDFTGPTQTTASLGLAETYTIHLLTACGHFPDGSVSCSTPSIGFAFHPGSTLRLDSTSLQQSTPDAYSPDLISSLSRYAKLSRWLAGAYIASALFLVLTIIVNCLSLAAGAFTSFIATVVLFSASIGGAIVFGNVNNAFNGSFQDKAGFSSSLGRVPTALSFVACTLALGAAITITLAARRASRSRRGRGSPLARSVGGKGDALLASGAVGVGADPYAAPGASIGGGGKKGGFLANVGSYIPGQKHKYVPVEAQPALVRTDVEGRQRGLDDEDWAGQDDYSHPDNTSHSNASAAGGAGGKNSDSVPLVSLGNQPSRDMNTAYEPYSSHSTGN